MDILADELGMDAVDCARRTHPEGSVPCPVGAGFTYDSGDYHKTLDVALEKIGIRRS